MKRMIKAAIILTIITILILGIINSLARFKTYEYTPVVSYKSGSSEVATISEARYSTKKHGSDLGIVSNILEYERAILISSIVLVVIFTFIFFNMNVRKK